MNEQRQQTYMKLISSLLNCPIGEESRILGTNQDLLDVGFLETVEVQAKIASQQGDENTANWLRYLVIQMPNDPKNLRTYIQLLGTLLEAIQNSESNAEVVYPILTANLDKLNDNFVQIVQSWAKSRLYKVKRKEEAQAIAFSIVNLSHFIEEFPLGNKSNTLEIAIAGYEIASNIFYDDKTIKAWAFIQRFLAHTYRARILGDKANNLEKAIAFLEAALEVLTRETNPEEWATTQHVLGVTYYDRIQGQKAKNLNKAISCYQAALQVFTRDNFPQEWANNQHNLGVVHNHEELPGEKAQNIETAIAHFQSALKVLTREYFPDKWANTHNDLGNSYLMRIYGERVQNIDKALISYQSALQVLTRSVSPNQWAMAQDNLADIYYQKSRWESLDNLELAIRCYQSALQVYTHELFPEKWANTLFSLGIAYIERVRGDEAENLEMVIACFKDALQVHTCEAFPDEWAKIQHELGLAYHKRIFGDKAENMELSIAYSHAALEVHTHEVSPHSWAGTQNSLGLAYSKRILGNKAENLEAATTFYKAALQIYTRETFPSERAMIQANLANIYEELGDIETALQYSKLALEVYTPKLFPVKCLLAARNLGDCAFVSQKWEVAIQGYQQAISAIENSRVWANNDTTRKDIMENTIYVYGKMIKACLNIGEKVKAIETAELSKTRNLIELILNRDLQTFYPQEVAIKLEKLQDEINAGQYYLDNGREENPTLLVQHLQNLRQQYKELQDKYLPVGSSFQFDQFLLTLDNRTAIIEWYITDNKILAFIIKPKPQTPVPTNGEEEITVWQSKPEDFTALVEWINEYLQSYKQQKDEWQNLLETRLKKLAEILHIEEILNQIPKHCDKLILIPHRYLHLFPLHALPIKESCLLELFPNGVSYAPSCQLLQLAQQRQRDGFDSIFAIQNPTEDLLFTDLEVNSILPLFSSHQVLPKTQATKTALSQATVEFQQANCLHFSCHGLFKPNSPLDSCLVLAGANEEEALDFSKCLTLGNLFDRNLDLNQCRLVTLSACETGLIDFNNTSDEYIGLPSGFIYAGAKSVVSSLWTVNDFSTALLMIRFYQNIKIGLSIGIALNQAQIWLRDSTQDDLWMWLQPLNLNEDFKEQVYKQLSWFDADEVPFNKAVYWGAFCAVGC
jgi:CHAT domain-containing protein